jgi:hypothetical protein
LFVDLFVYLVDLFVAAAASTFLRHASCFLPTPLLGIKLSTDKKH